MAAFEGVAHAGNKPLLISPIFGEAIYLNLLFFSKKDPVLLYASFSVERGILTIKRRVGKGDFNDQFCSIGMRVAEIALRPTDHRDGGLRFRILEGERLLLSYCEAVVHPCYKQAVE